MTNQLQHKNSTACGETTLPVEFIAVCAVAFVASVAATVYFCRSMCCEVEMPGGWTMSMMWTRMPGQTWFASATSFLLMWLAMMIAMMLPSALPAFLKTRRAPVSLSVMATGYFAVWLAVGVGIYVLGVAFAAATMRWETFSRIIPMLSGTALIAAGALQFTRWKMTGLLDCRSPSGCVTGCPERETNFRLGCKQGVACCICCVAPTMILIVLGMMNPLVIIGVAVSRRWPQPEQRYRAWHRGEVTQPFALGQVEFVQVEGDVWIGNLIGQHGMGFRDGLPPVRYDAIREGLRQVAAKAKELGASVHMPRVGCGLAGGQWEEVERIIQEELAACGIAATVYDLPS